MQFTLWQLLIGITFIAGSLACAAANFPEAMWAVMLFGGLWLVHQLEPAPDCEVPEDD